MPVDADTISDFRGYYPEFADDSAWADAQVQRALEAGDSETGSGRWGGYTASPASLKARGLYAYAAHSLVLARARLNAVEAGGVPSAANQAQSKTVGDESVTYSAPSYSASEAAQVGDLDATMYGQEFMRLRRRAGTGAATTGGIL